MEPALDSRAQIKVFVYKLCMFSLVVLVLLGSANTYLEEGNPDLYNRAYRELIDHKVKANVVILGSSRSRYGLNPRYLDGEGKTFYNFSAEGAGGGFYNAWYKTVFKRNYPKPEAIILEVSNHLFFSRMGTFLDSKIEYFPLKIFLDTLFNPEFSVDYKTMFKKKTKSLLLDRVFSFSLGEPEDETRMDGPYHGFVPFMTGPMNSVVADPEDLRKFPVDPDRVQPFLDLVEQLQADGIKVILVDLPDFLPGRISNPETVAMLRNIAKEKGVDFLDYNSGDRVSGLNFDEKYFANYYHINIEGGKVFARRLKRDLELILGSKKAKGAGGSIEVPTKGDSVEALSDWARFTGLGKEARWRGDYSGAESYFTGALHEAEKFDVDDSRLLESIYNLSSINYMQGKLAEGERLFDRALSLRKRRADWFYSNIFSVQAELIRTYAKAGRFDKVDSLPAHEAFEEWGIDPLDPRFVKPLHDLARAYIADKRFSEAEPLLRRVIDIRVKNLGTSNPFTALSQDDLGVLYMNLGRRAEALPLLSWEKCDEYGMEALRRGDHFTARLFLQEALKKTEMLGPHDQRRPVALSHFEEAKPLYVDQDWDSRLTSLSWEESSEFGMMAMQSGDHGRARLFFEDALKKTGDFNPQDSRLITSLNNLAGAYQAQDKFAEAEPLLKRALVICEKKQDLSSLGLSLSQNNLAELYQTQGKLVEAESLFRNALSIREKELGTSHPDVVSVRNNLGSIYLEQGRIAEARQLMSWEKLVHVVTQATQDGKYLKAMKYFEGVFKIAEEFDPQDPRLGSFLDGIIAVYQGQAKPDEAEEFLERVLSVRLGTTGLFPVDSIRNNLGAIYLKQGRVAEAKQLMSWDELVQVVIRETQEGQYSEAMEDFEKILKKAEEFDPRDPRLGNFLDGIIGIYQAQAKPAEAKKFLERVLSVRLEKLGSSYPATVSVQNGLGMLGQKQVIDISPANFKKKDLFYSVSRAFGLFMDQDWRYAQDGSMTVLQRRFHMDLASVELMDIDFYGMSLKGDGQGRRASLVLRIGFGKKFEQKETLLRPIWDNKPLTSKLQVQIVKGGEKEILRIELGQLIRDYYKGKEKVFLEEVLLHLPGQTDKILQDRSMRRVIFLRK